MPHYIEDPDNPGQHIDVIELLGRIEQSGKVTPNRRIIGALLRRDVWTRRDALLILSGFHPETALDITGNPDIDRLAYLDGLRSHNLRMIRRIHPRDLESTREFLTLSDYAHGQDMAECKSPAEWLAWAESKGFRPYWLKGDNALQIDVVVEKPVKPWDSMTGEEKEAEWNSLSPDERRLKAVELTKKHNGNKTAAGSEVGVTGNRIGQLVREYQESLPSSAPSTGLPDLTRLRQKKPSKSTIHKMQR